MKSSKVFGSMTLIQMKPVGDHSRWRKWGCYTTAPAVKDIPLISNLKGIPPQSTLCATNKTTTYLWPWHLHSTSIHGPWYVLEKVKHTDLTHRKIQAVCRMWDGKPSSCTWITAHIEWWRPQGDRWSQWNTHASVFLLSGNTKILDGSTTALCIHDDV